MSPLLELFLLIVVPPLTWCERYVIILYTINLKLNVTLNSLCFNIFVSGVFLNGFILIIYFLLSQSSSFFIKFVKNNMSMSTFVFLFLSSLMRILSISLKYDIFTKPVPRL